LVPVGGGEFWARPTLETNAAVASKTRKEIGHLIEYIMISVFQGFAATFTCFSSNRPSTLLAITV
jgi:hypothetical protein